jgi:hypothetical protein
MAHLINRAQIVLRPSRYRRIGPGSGPALPREERFRNMSEWVSWPRLEVFRFLRARARGLSIHELDGWILQNTEHQVVFKQEPKAVENGSHRIRGIARGGLRK